MIPAWAVTVVFQLDCLLNALRGGPRNTTLSLSAARAQERGSRWGCVLCAWLHATLRQRHCRLVLRGVPITGYHAFLAGVQLLLLGGALFYGVPLLLWRL